MGTAERGEAAVAKLHFPGLGKDGAELLVARGVGAVGIDTPSIDHGQSKNFETHVALMTNDIPAFENVADMSALPPTGATIVALPMKIGRLNLEYLSAPAEQRVSSALRRQMHISQTFRR